MMKTITLHRSPEGWWVADYPLLIIKHRQVWLICDQPGSLTAGCFLQQSNLARQRFPTRKQALQAVQLALQVHQLNPEQVHYRRLHKGCYQLAGNLKAKRAPRGWEILDHQQRVVGRAVSLWHAAQKAKQQTYELSDDSFNY